MTRLFSAAAAVWHRLQDGRTFAVIARRGDLRLEAPADGDLTVLRDIWVERMFADWFPFGRVATIVDLGAHKGYFTIFAARAAAPGSRLIAVEPSSANLVVLKRNLAANGVVANIVEAAVADTRGYTVLHTGRAENHSLDARHHERVGRAPAGGSETVAQATLADIFSAQSLTRVDYLKVHIEGGEYACLLSASSAVLGRIGVVAVEFHDAGPGGPTARDLADHLQRNGFTIARFTHRPTWINNNHGHLLAVRPAI